MSKAAAIIQPLGVFLYSIFASTIEFKLPFSLIFTGNTYMDRLGPPGLSRGSNLFSKTIFSIVLDILVRPQACSQIV